MTVVRTVELRLVELPLVRPFATSFGTMTRRSCIVVRIETDESFGWSECVAEARPGYSSEWNDGAWLMIRDILTPAVLAAGDLEADGLGDVLGSVRGHPMAKATMIDALLDAELRALDRSLAAHLGADKERVACGVSLGITPTTEELIQQVGRHVEEGYRRIKLKIEPGVDLERVRAVREEHPDVLLSVDANGAYTLDQARVFEALDQLDLLMIEQPLHHEDLLQHADLQRRIRTDVCLDESIRSAADAAAAIELGACRIINVKQGRVGGILEARRVHDVCRRAGVPVWCGGMLETGIGRATNLALAAMPGFILPGDTSASARYFAEDLTEPFVLGADGTMGVPEGPGIGVEPVPDRLDTFTVRTEILTASRYS